MTKRRSTKTVDIFLQILTIEKKIDWKVLKAATSNSYCLFHKENQKSCDHFMRMFWVLMFNICSFVIRKWINKVICLCVSMCFAYIPHTHTHTHKHTHTHTHIYIYIYTWCLGTLFADWYKIYGLSIPLYSGSFTLWKIAWLSLESNSQFYVKLNYFQI